MTAPYIGSVTLDYPVFRQNPDRPTVLGSDTVTKDGSIVSLVYVNPTQDRREVWTFEFETKETVEELQALWLAGGTYTADPEGSGSTVSIRFSRANPDGVANVKGWAFGEKTVHSAMTGYDTGRYNGELNVIVEAP
jgi:hypothetical protein